MDYLCFHFLRFFHLTKRLRDMPVDISREDILLPTVRAFAHSSLLIHILTQSHSITQSHTHIHCICTLTRSPTHSLMITHSLTHSHNYTLTHNHTYTHTHSQSHLHILTHSHTHNWSLTPMHSLTHSFTHYSLSPSLPSSQMLKFKITSRDLRLEHVAMADIHFSEERARLMEIAARRLKNRSTFSLTSDMSDIT